MWKRESLQNFPNFPCFSFFLKMVETGARSCPTSWLKQNQSVVVFMCVVGKPSQEPFWIQALDFRREQYVPTFVLSSHPNVSPCPETREASSQPLPKRHFREPFFGKRCDCLNSCVVYIWFLSLQREGPGKKHWKGKGWGCFLCIHSIGRQQQLHRHLFACIL